MKSLMNVTCQSEPYAQEFIGGKGEKVMRSNIFRPVTVDSKEELMDAVQEHDLLKQYRPSELVEALYLQGNVERFDTAKSTILVIPKEVMT